MDKPWTPVSVHHLKTQIIAYINTMIDINTRMNIFIVVIDQKFKNMLQLNFYWFLWIFSHELDKQKNALAFKQSLQDRGGNTLWFLGNKLHKRD